MIASNIVDGAGRHGPPLARGWRETWKIGAEPGEFAIGLGRIRLGQAVLIFAHLQAALGGGLGEQVRHLNPIGVSSTHRSVP